MYIIRKIKEKNGRRNIYFCGIKIFSYRKNDCKNINPEYHFKYIGKGSEIQDGCRIYNQSKIYIGNNVRIGNGALIEGMGGLKIGNNVIFGPDVTVWTANHNYEKPTKLPYDEKVIFKPVSIEDNVWVGGKSIILPGVTIHEGAVIGMGAVVTQDVPKCAVVGGNPAKVLKYRDIKQYEQLKKEKKIFLFEQE